MKELSRRVVLPAAVLLLALLCVLAPGMTLADEVADADDAGDALELVVEDDGDAVADEAADSEEAAQVAEIEGTVTDAVEDGDETATDEAADTEGADGEAESAAGDDAEADAVAEGDGATEVEAEAEAEVEAEAEAEVEADDATGSDDEAEAEVEAEADDADEAVNADADEASGVEDAAEVVVEVETLADDSDSDSDTDSDDSDSALSAQASSSTDVSVSLVYGAYVLTYGWSYGVSSDATEATTIGAAGLGVRLEALQLSVASSLGGSIRYRVSAQGYGWLDWASDGATAGAAALTKLTEAVQIRLTGELAEAYDVWYRVYVEDYGWLDWACNGETAGTVDLYKRLEAVQVVLVAKGGAAPGDTDAPCVEAASVSAAVYQQSSGWLSAVSDGETAGTAGGSLRLEALRLTLSAYEDGSIAYSVYVDDGWQGWVSDGETAGTAGSSLSIEAVKIELTGDAAEAYDVWYRVYVQGFGWLDWACNGEAAGTVGYGYRVEAIQVVVQVKNTAAPGDTDTPYKETTIDQDEAAMLAKAQSYSSSTKYLILVNTTTNRVGIYTGSKGNWVEVYYWQCSTGASSTPTVKGEFTVKSKGYSFGSGYTCYYYTQFYGNYLFHSILYNQGTFTVQDGRLGMNISHGCVRLALANAKWIYNNIPVSTKVVVY